MDFHIRRKLPGLDDGVGGAGLGDEVVVQALTIAWGGGLGETGAVAAGGVGGQGELADDEQAAGGA